MSMTAEIMMNDSTNWTVVGNPVPPPLDATTSSAEDGDPSRPLEWEMIAEEEEGNENKDIVESEVSIPTTNYNNSSGNNECVVVRRGPSSNSKQEQRPRSATIGGEAAAANARLASTHKSSSFGCEKKILRAASFPSRTLRRCASTPDLVVCDSAHVVIVEDESDSEDYDCDEDYEGEQDIVRIGSETDMVEEEDEEESDGLLEESFEVLSAQHHEYADAVEDDEPFTIGVDDDFTNEDVESATLVSTPSIGTSSWTIPSSVVPTTTPTSVWGMTKSPSFKDVLLAKSGVDGACDAGVFGKDRALTEAKLRDPHRHHHLRVRTKPKFIVADDGNNSESKMMRHANSTGDLTRMLSNVQEGHESSIGQGGRNRRSKKQLSATMEEDEDADFVIGRGSGGFGDGAVGGSGILGETDAMDYYQRKEHGSRSISNKKKERPDEAKRREIIMYKKEVQRSQNGESQKTSATGDLKKKKNEKGVGGKKERRRL